MNNDWRTLEPYDWRYSAAITGLIRYFKYFDEKKDDWKIENECLIYNPASITQHDYLKFVEDNYSLQDNFNYVDNLYKKILSE